MKGQKLTCLKNFLEIFIPTLFYVFSSCSFNFSNTFFLRFLIVFGQHPKYCAVSFTVNSSKNNSVISSASSLVKYPRASSSSCISEEWCELADKGQCLLEKIIAEETVRELMDLLTERQRQMIQRIYFQQKTQKEVSHELGITVPAVSKCISQAMQKMRNNSDNSARALEKGDWKYAW